MFYETRKGVRSKDTTKSEQFGQTNKRKKENMAGTSKEDANKNSSQAIFLLSTYRKTQSRKATKKMA
jgi:hypothetical protein